MSHFLYKNHIENNSKFFQPNDIGIMQGKISDEIYQNLNAKINSFLQGEEKIILNPEDENIAGDKRSDIESYFFNKNLLSDDFKSLMYNYYLYYFGMHKVLDPLVNRADNLKFDIKMSILNIIKPNQYRYFNYGKYPYQILICIKSPDDIFFRDSLKNGRISCLNHLFFRSSPITPEASSHSYLNRYYQSIDFLLKEKEFLFLSLKNHSFIQYPFFNIENHLENKYIYLSIYLN